MREQQGKKHWPYPGPVNRLIAERMDASDQKNHQDVPSMPMTVFLVYSVAQVVNRQLHYFLPYLVDATWHVDFETRPKNAFLKINFNMLNINQLRGKFVPFLNFLTFNLIIGSDIIVLSPFNFHNTTWCIVVCWN